MKESPAPRFAPLFATFVVFALLAPISISAQSGAFGHSVVVTADEVIVAEPTTTFRPGAVYTYRKVTDGWEEAAVLNAPDSEVADGFGTVLSLSGEHLFVGQRGGPIHVFTRSGDGWRHDSEIAGDHLAGFSPSCSFDGYCGTDFGISLAADDGWLMVGAPGPAGGRGRNQADEPPPAGVVHVYRLEDGGWTRQGELRPSDGVPGDRFGAAMALTANGLLVGAPAWGADAETAGSGRVYHFSLSEGEWAEVAALENAAAVNAGFGSSISALDEFALVGAPGYEENRGIVFVYSWMDGWALVADELEAAEGAGGDRFGESVAVVGDAIWVGSPNARGEETGSAWVFENALVRADPPAPRRVRLPTDETVERDRFGGLVAGADGVVAVTAPGMHHRAGSVHLFEEGERGEWSSAGMLVSAPDFIAPLVGEERHCTDGRAGPFDCDEVELLAYVPGSILKGDGSARGVRANDNWGWTDPVTGREYALVGRNDGTSFIDITAPTNPILVGDLPKPRGTPPSQLWRDIKTYKDHAFIVADGAGDHGMQVLDLTRLRDIRHEEMPVIFEPDVHYRGVASSHNIVINEETGFAYAVGSGAGRESCGGGLHMIDINDPRSPEFVGCYRDESGTHDSQCVTYRGPDERYLGREICLNSNGRSFEIADVTDKESPTHIARATSPNAAYIHQGWLTPDHRYFYQDDESDVIAGAVETTRTLIWDLSDLEDPILAREFMGSLPASAHNLYIKDGFVYQANYRYGLHVLDISDPLNPREVGKFDTAPLTEGPGFGGAWSVYPYFESGTVIVTSMQEGLFVLRRRRPIS